MVEVKVKNITRNDKGYSGNIEDEFCLIAKSSTAILDNLGKEGYIIFNLSCLGRVVRQIQDKRGKNINIVAIDSIATQCTRTELKEALSVLKHRVSDNRYSMNAEKRHYSNDVLLKVEEVRVEDDIDMSSIQPKNSYSQVYILGNITIYEGYIVKLCNGVTISSLDNFILKDGNLIEIREPVFYALARFVENGKKDWKQCLLRHIKYQHNVGEYKRGYQYYVDEKNKVCTYIPEDNKILKREKSGTVMSWWDESYSSSWEEEYIPEEDKVFFSNADYAHLYALSDAEVENNILEQEPDK